MSCGSFPPDRVWFNCSRFRKNSVKANPIAHEISYCLRAAKVAAIDVSNFKGVLYVAKPLVIDSSNYQQAVNIRLHRDIK